MERRHTVSRNDRGRALCYHGPGEGMMGISLSQVGGAEGCPSGLRAWGRAVFPNVCEGVGAVLSGLRAWGREVLPSVCSGCIVDMVISFSQIL